MSFQLKVSTSVSLFCLKKYHFNHYNADKSSTRYTYL